MFNADWTNLALGRSRNANDAQRLILAARDQGCTHCAAHTENTHAHHPTPHAAGGETTIANLQLLCGPCHTHHHRTDNHNRTGESKDHKRSKQPPAQPPDTPTRTRPPPTTADTGTNTLTTRGP